MNCQQVITQLNDFMDGYLEPSATQALQGHLADCPNCAAVVAAEQKFRLALRQMVVPPPVPGFAERVLENAMHQETKSHGWWAGFAAGGGMAAAVMLFLFFGLPFQGAEKAIQQLAGVTLAVGAAHTIQMVVNVPSDLAGSTISILLPEHIELDGYPGERQITWTTDLRKGANLLALPVIGMRPGAGTLVARVEHENKRKVFEVGMDVRPELSSGLWHSAWLARSWQGESIWCA
jgi:hypothetical protein